MAMTAAREIVQQDGMRALTARSLAAAIGYSPGTLYNLFQNLDELALHVNAATLDALYDSVARDGRTGDPDADLHRMLEHYLAFLDANPALWSAVFDFRQPSETDLPEWYRDRIGKLMRLIEEALAPLFAAGEEAERREAASVLWSSLHGICTLAQDGRLSLVSAHSVPQMARSLIANYLVGLRARAGKRRRDA